MKPRYSPILIGTLIFCLAVPVRAAVSDLLPGLNSDDINARNEAEKTLFREAAHAGRPGAEAERLAYSEDLCRALAQDPPLLTAHALLAQVRTIGGSESVRTLNRLLRHDDATLREAARMALAANPSPEATGALVAGLRNADDPGARIGFIEALGGRRTPEAVSLLGDALADPAFAPAAAAALAHIPEARAARALIGARPAGDTGYRTHALLDLAATSRRAGNQRIAAGIYTHLLNDEEPESVLAAAITGYLTLPTVNVRAALDYIEHPSEYVQAAVVEAASQADAPRLQRRLASRLPEVSPELQLRILTMVEGTAAPGTEELVIPFLDAEDDDLANAAVAALAVVGTERSIPALMKVQAIDAMSRIPSPGVDRLIGRVAAGGSAEERPTAIQVLASRQGPDSTPALLSFARDDDLPVALAALTALQQVAPAATMPELIELMMNAGESARARQAMDTVVSVLRRSPDAEATVAVLTDGLADADESRQSMIYTLLIQAGTDEALGPLVQATHSEDVEVRVAAIHALTSWREGNAIAPLIALAGDEGLELKEHVLVMRGLARLLGSARRPDLDACSQGLEAARRPDEKKLMLAAIGQSDSRDALSLVEPYLEDSDVQAEATAAKEAIQQRIESR